MEFFIIRNGEQTGPFSPDTVKALLNSGSLTNADMAWRKGLPAWLPLGEILNPGSEKPNDPPPMSGVQAAPKKKANAKQKALLGYLGTAFEDDLTREQAALLISDALENPKLTVRFSKWGEEKIRLHPDAFQEEVDHRRTTRVARYLEVCQTDGAEVIKDVTKAHVQVLIESLDKRRPNWDQEARAALWDYLLPAVEESFPQLMRPEWKGKLKFGGTPKIAAVYTGTQGAGMLTPPSPPGAIQAALRGVLYGVIVLGAVLAGFYWYQNRHPATPSSPPPKTAAVAPPAAPASANSGETAPPAHPTDAPLVAATPTAEPKPAPATPANTPGVDAPTPAPTPTVAANPNPPIPENPPVPAPMPPPANTFTPAPPPPSLNQPTPPANTPGTAATPAPANPAPPGANKDIATLTKSVAVQLQFGRVTLTPGTKVRLIALEGQNARVNFNNNVILIPIIATDIDPAAVAAAALASPPAIPATAPTPAPPSVPTPPVVPKPSSDL